MKLLEIWNADLDKCYKLYSDFLPNENGFENPTFGMNFDQFKQYVDLCHDNSKGERLRPGRVPDSKYVLIDDNNNYVGIFNLRHYLNDFLANGAGHIGYGIAKEYRGKGYASEGLRLTLEKCKELNIKEVYMSVNIDNPASLKVQLKNGAYVHHQDDIEYYTRINL